MKKAKLHQQLFNRKKLAYPLIMGGLFLSSGFAYAAEAEANLNAPAQELSEEDKIQQEKIAARLKEIDAEAKAAAKTV